MKENRKKVPAGAYRNIHVREVDDDVFIQQSKLRGEMATILIHAKYIPDLIKALKEIQNSIIPPQL